MADIREILATDFISDSREDLNNNFNLIASDFAGNAFPNNPTIGMVCYRTDQKKAYRYVEGGKWKVEGAVLTVESESPDDQGNVNLPLVTDEQIANILGGVDVGGVEPSILESQVLFFIQQEVAKAQAQIATQVDERVAQAKRDILNTSFPVGGDLS